MATQNTTAQRIYRSLLDGGLVQDANSTYWQARFRAAAKELAARMGEDPYRAWFDGKFPEGGNETYQERWQVVSAKLERIHELDAPTPPSAGTRAAGVGEHRGAEIARALNIPVDDEPEPGV